MRRLVDKRDKELALAVRQVPNLHAPSTVADAAPHDRSASPRWTKQHSATAALDRLSHVRRTLIGSDQNWFGGGGDQFDTLDDTHR